MTSSFPSGQRDLLKEYQTIKKDALSPEETLEKLRSSGLSAMIDAENGLWVNEMCMGQYNCIYAQNKVDELTSGVSLQIKKSGTT